MNNVADLERPTDASSNDPVTGVRKTRELSEPQASTDEIVIDTSEFDSSDEPKPTPAPRKPSLPPPPPAAALRVRVTTAPPPAAQPRSSAVPPPLPSKRPASWPGTVASPLPSAATVSPSAASPLPSAAPVSPLAAIAAPRPSYTPPSATADPDAVKLKAELERLQKRMRERDTYLAELEAVYAQRSDALAKAEAKLLAQAEELDARAVRIRELELHVRTLIAEAAPAPAGDDLTQIRGIGPHYARMLEQLDVRSFAQIAQWTAEDCVHFGKQLKVNPGRIERDQWVDQAKVLSDPSLAQTISVPAPAPIPTTPAEAAALEAAGL